MYTIEAYLGGAGPNFTTNNRMLLTTQKSNCDDATNQLNEFKTRVGQTPDYVTLTFDVNLDNPFTMDATSPSFEVKNPDDSVVGPFDVESTYQSLINLGHDGLVINKKFDGNVDGFIILVFDNTKLTLKP